MANRDFYVAPLGGFNAAGAIDATLTAERGQRKIDKMKEGAAEVMRSGNPDDISAFMVQNPQMLDVIKKATGHKNETTAASLLNAAKRISSGENPVDVMEGHVGIVDKEDGSPNQSVNLLGRFLEDPSQAIPWANNWIAMNDPKAWQGLRESQGLGEKPSTPATDIDDYVADAEAQYLLDNPDKKAMPPGERNKARREFKRVQKDEAAGVKTAVTTAELSVRAKLEPAVRTAVDNAAANVKTQVDAAAGKRSNDLAWNVYDTGMRNLVDALSGTTTGPGVNWIPALTTNAQVANGAIAAMKPVLKQMFRASGEGVFTDKDAEILFAMLPDRNDLPEARDAKINGINMLVQAKLGMSGQAPPAPPAAAVKAPPVQGAKQAPDGNWYVEENGKFFRVE